MPGQMSQMVTERPNAGAVGHQDRRGVIRRPGGGGFASIVAHVSLRLTSLPSLRNIRTEFAYINHTHCGHARAV